MDDRQLFTDAEYCIDKYFDEHLKPRLGELMKFREDTKAGTLATGFGVRNALLPTREYASDVTFGFPANDIEKLWSEIGNDPDIETLATAWRTAAEARWVRSVMRLRLPSWAATLPGCMSAIVLVRG